MFKWIKVVAQLSKQDDVMLAFDAKVNGVTVKMEKLSADAARMLADLQSAKAEAESEIERLKKCADEFKKTIDESSQKIAAGKADVAKITGEMQSYQDALGQKVEELQKVALEHLDSVNEKVKAYDSNVSELGREIVRLGDSIAEFQKR